MVSVRVSIRFSNKVSVRVYVMVSVRVSTRFSIRVSVRTGAVYLILSFWLRNPHQKGHHLFAALNAVTGILKFKTQE